MVRIVAPGGGLLTSIRTATGRQPPCLAVVLFLISPCASLLPLRSDGERTQLLKELPRRYRRGLVGTWGVQLGLLK